MLERQAPEGWWVRPNDEGWMATTDALLLLRAMGLDPYGDDALRDMCDARHVFTGRVPEPSADPLWFPYSSKAYRWQMRVLRALFSRGSIVKRIGKLF